MTIRKQFSLLSFFIFSFLVLLSGMVLSYNHKTIPEKKYLKTYLESKNNSVISDKDLDELVKSIKHLSPDFQLVILDKSGDVVFSTFQEFNNCKKTDYNFLSNLVTNSSDNYYYQFTTFNTKDKPLYIISRNLKQSKGSIYSQNIFIRFHIYVSTLIFVLLFFLFYVYYTIFKSINVLQTKAEQIADGDLSQKIDLENKSSANEIISLAKNLERMRISLIDAQNRRNRFVMGISHDLRTPVSVIKGYTEAINDGIISEPEDIKNTLKLITTKTEQLEEMIETLINYTKLNSSEIRVNMTIGSINQFIENFAKYAVITGPVFKRKITSDIRLDHNINLLYNEQLINRVFENLLTNAIRYSNEGDSIHISAVTENNFIIIKIIDSGIGIGKDDLDHIFDLFYKASSSRKEQGFGVGLSVVKNILNTHGWGIDVESELNVGSTFTIRILYSDTDIIPEVIS